MGEVEIHVLIIDQGNSVSMDNQDVLYKNKYQTLMVGSFLVGAVFSVFALINLLNGQFLEALIELVLIGLIGLSAWKLKSILTSKYSHVFTIGFTCLIVIVWLSVASLDSTPITSFMWVFAMPIIAYALNGVRHGFMLTVLITTVAMVIYYTRYPSQEFAFNFIEWLNVGLCLATIWVAVHFYEKGNFVSKKTLIKRVIHDRLTGLKTRDQLYKTYKQYPNNEHSLILIDIDQLSKINATHGYLMGDVVLISMAKIITENMPDSAHAFRTGGDEFAIFLPNSHNHKETHIDLVGRIFAEMQAYQTVCKNDIIKVEVSMAKASLMSDGDNLNILIKQADELMKQAKTSKHHKIAM